MMKEKMMFVSTLSVISVVISIADVVFSVVVPELQPVRVTVENKRIATHRKDKKDLHLLLKFITSP